MESLQTELMLLYLACGMYSVFGFAVLFDQFQVRHRKALAALTVSALVVHSYSIALRWMRADHGPFINLFEILTSNVWSNMFGLTLFYLFFSGQTRAFRFVLPIVLVMILWLLYVPTQDSFLPPTYNTIWLYFHVFSGKFFFTLLLLSSGLAAQSLWLHYRSPGNPEIAAYTQLSYLMLAIAFVFESFMLFFGAIWAQDAWGRYWSWDPLETWAFATWLCVAFTLHFQVDAKRGPVFLWLIPLCLVVAFLTFYGVPFISTAAHKGMV